MEVVILAMKQRECAIHAEERIYMNKTDKIYVAGHRGLVGSAIVRNLEAKGYTNVIGRTHKELDLTNQQAVRDFFENEKPDVVVLAAAKVGASTPTTQHPRSLPMRICRYNAT